MRIVIPRLTHVQKGQTPLQIAEQRGHASIATLIRNEPKRLEEEKARAAAAAPAAGEAAAAAAAAEAEAKRKETANAAAKVASSSFLYAHPPHPPDVC
jgi:septal ring factor EnvC (AmiA/AmiB activator)